MGDMALRKISELFMLQQDTPPHFKVFQSETSRSLLHLYEVQRKRYHLALVSGNLQIDRFVKKFANYCTITSHFTKINVTTKSNIHFFILKYESS